MSEAGREPKPLLIGLMSAVGLKAVVPMRQCNIPLPTPSGQFG